MRNNEKQNKVKKTCLGHGILKRRIVEGEFHTFCPSLEDHEENYFIYFRTCSYQFNMLLSKIKIDITKQNTHFGEAIPG